MYPRVVLLICALLYWGSFLVSILMSVFVFIKGNKMTSVLQFWVSIVSPIWAFIFCLKRDYIYPGLERNELYFMYKQVLNLNLEAIVIVLLYILWIVLFVYNLVFLINSSKKTRLDDRIKRGL